MSTESQFVKLISRLLELTRARQLRWEKDPETHRITQGTEDVVDVAYLAEKEGKTLRLYERKFREPPDAPWESQPVLEIIDGRGVSEWTFPVTGLAWQLLEAVRYQTSGIEDFVSKMLEETDDTGPIKEIDIFEAFSRIPGLTREEIDRHVAECRMRLNRVGVKTKAQLNQLVNSQQILDWIRSIYISELKRSPEKPLDPVAVAVWGGALISNGFNEQTKTQILNELKRSPEYREKNK